MTHRNFKKGDRVRFSAEAHELAIRCIPPFTGVVTSNQRIGKETVRVLIDGLVNPQTYHQAFLEHDESDPGTEGKRILMESFMGSGT